MHDESEHFCLDPGAIMRMADNAGLPKPQQTTEVLAFALAVAEYCAEIGDRYRMEGESCGDEIRSRFGLG